MTSNVPDKAGETLSQNKIIRKHFTISTNKHSEEIKVFCPVRAKHAFASVDIFRQYICNIRVMYFAGKINEHLRKSELVFIVLTKMMSLKCGQGRTEKQ